MNTRSAHARLCALLPAIAACGPAPHRHDGAPCPDHPEASDTGSGGDTEAPSWTELRASAGAFSEPFSPTRTSLTLVLPLGVRDVTLTATATGGPVLFDGASTPDNTWSGDITLAGRSVAVVGPTGQQVTVVIVRGAEAAADGVPVGQAYAAALAAHGDTLAAPAVRGGARGAVTLLEDGASASLGAVEGDGHAEAFGAAVALNDAFLFVGAPGADGGEGRVAVYRRESDGTLTAVQELRSPTTGEKGLFGYALGISGEAAAPSLLVGAPGLDPDGRSAAGGVFVFTWSGAAFQRAEVWQPPGLVAGERFGSSIAVDGVASAIGAPGGPEGGRVLRMDGSTPTGWLRPPRLHPGDDFGAALHLMDGELLVGAPGMDERPFGEPAQNVGRIWHFFPNGSVEVYGLDHRTRARLGSSIARSGPLLAFGAPSMDGHAGGVLLVDRADASSRLLFSAATNAHFGAALAFTGETLWIGAPWSADPSPLFTLR